MPQIDSAVATTAEWLERLKLEHERGEHAAHTYVTCPLCSPLLDGARADRLAEYMAKDPIERRQFAFLPRGNA